MEARNKSRIAAIIRTAGFGVSHATDWTPVAPAPATPAQTATAALFLQLSAEDTGILARMSQMGVDILLGTGGFHGGTTAKSVQRDGIQLTLKGINEGVAAVAAAQKRPELMDSFRMPHGDDDLLKRTALAFATNAAAIEDDLIALGFEENFIEDLKERVRKFGEADKNKDEGLQGQVGSGDGLDGVIDEGLLVLKQLNVLMKNLYKADAVKLGEWTTAAHIERVWTSGKKKPATDGTTPA